MAKQDTDGHATESEQIISIKVEDPYSSITASLREMAREFTPLLPDCWIFRAPKRERESDKKAFDPLAVSIGPFHHGKEELQHMEKVKAVYLDAFVLSRSDPISLETLFIKMIKDWEDKIRKCYAEKIEFSSDDFVKMILLDSWFVLQVIIFGFQLPLIHPTILMDVVTHDLILLENQLPFFVLEGLFNLAFPNTEERFINQCLKYVCKFSVNGDIDLFKERMSQQTAEVKHLLDLLRKCQAPTIPKQMPDDSSGRKTTMRNATVLEKAGLVIKPSLNQSSATDIRYARGVLEIPQVGRMLSVDVLRNLIALELFLYERDTYICDYIHFMDNLIKTGKDVDLLIRNEVFDILGDPESVATALKSLGRPGRPIDVQTYYYYGIQEDIKKYSRVNWHTWRASLRRDYCNSPWIIASTIGAIILLLLTFIQAVCSIISV